MRRLAPVLLLLASGCVPSLGPFSLASVSGHVVDRESGAPIGGAEVIEWYRGAGRIGGPQPVYHSRFTTADPDGRFAFESAVAPSARMWFLKTYGPTYSFFHPDYGVQHTGSPRTDAELLLRGAKDRAEQALADLAPYCRGEHDDPGSRRLADVGCPNVTPSRNSAP